MKRFWKRNGIVLMSAVILVAPRTAFGQALVYPKLSEAGAREKYVLRVPNERDVATTRVEIRFPRSLRVVSFAEVPGWALEILGDSANHVIGAAWTGSLAPKRFVEFPFIAVNPKAAVRLVWPIYQAYSNGEHVDWTGKEDAKQPASVTTVRVSSPRSSGVLLALWVCIGALVLSVGGLVLALRPDGSPDRFHPGS
jgi:uncharacterized protein YcnI